MSRMSIDEKDKPNPAAPGDRLLSIGLPGGRRGAANETSDQTRRDFFKVMGLSASAVMAACRRAPGETILPYTRKPDELIPGVAVWYATACDGCSARCGLLVKTRDGRPIKVEGNPSHPVSRGAVCAAGQASLIGLYDADRARAARLDGRAASWKEIDGAVAAALAPDALAGRQVRVVIPWGLGPTEEAALDLFLSRHGARAVRFDPMGARDALLAAHEALYGARVVPEYRLDAADVVVSVNADFLGSFLAPAPQTRHWSAARNPSRHPMLRHVQIEANMSITGGAADERIALPPSAELGALAAIVGALAPSGDAPAAAIARAVLAALPAASRDDRALATGAVRRRIAAAAGALGAAGSRGLVLCGSDDPAAQLLAALANALLGNARTTAVLDAASAIRDGELGIDDLSRELGAGTVGALFFVGTNPALVDARIAAALPSVPFTLSTSDRLDETAALATAHAPEGHFLEAWRDARPRPGVDVMGQPCVTPLHDTRARAASLLTWAGQPGDVHAFLKTRWQSEVLGGGKEAGARGDLVAFWDAAVRDGIVDGSVAPSVPELGARPDAALALIAAAARPAPLAGAMQLVLYASIGLGDGTGASPNNAWLQELPDPISKVTWGNYAALAPARARAMGVEDGDLVAVRAGDTTVQLPALRQPGLPDDVVAVAVGHGRARAGRIAAGHGTDAWPLARAGAGTGALARAGIAVSVARTDGQRPLALTQTHASQEGRELVRQVDLEELLAGGGRGRGEGEGQGQGQGEERPEPDARRGLWSGHAYPGHRWAMTIDLNACTGCGACVVSCNAENNIPVVGETEVRRRREMHWMRIDRYYGGDPDAPELLHQPMMCQHCENAPCETVCPVVATVHSSEGLNQQVYNRCVGTRYCANNCPTKARRFNWFDYDRGGPLERMVLNPDVVVRSRGVMEKCSMCVHRIEEGRALANREGRTLADGDVVTACQQSCPAQAITFGDRNDPASTVSHAMADGRAYRILEEINIGPQVAYLSRVKNRGEHV